MQPEEHVKYWRAVVPDHEAAFERLRKEVPWQKVMWKTGRYLPRLCCHNVHDYAEGAKLMRWLRSFMPFDFELHGTFGNYYRDGSDYLPHHRDEYKGPDGSPLSVISLSFGATRNFSFKGPGPEAKSYPLHSGDVIVFDSYMNDKFTHGIPKQASVQGGRINITCFVKVLGAKLIAGLDENHIMSLTGRDELLARQLQEDEWA